MTTSSAGFRLPNITRCARSVLQRPALCAAAIHGLVLGTLAASAGFAQDITPQNVEATVLDDTITVSANRDPLPTEQSGSSVTVITSDEIEQRNPLLVADLLRTVAGVELTQTGGPGQATSLRVRGGTAQQALVLLDGVRINTAANGDVDFAHLASTGIERVEILRGPQAVYGSEAMSGVISLITTQDPQRFGGSMQAEAGSREHRRFTLGLHGSSADQGEQLSSQRPRLNWRLALSDLETDAVSQLAPRLGGAERDPYDNRTLSGGAGLNWDRSALRLSAYDSSGDTSLDGFGVDDTNANATTDQRTVALHADLVLAPRWRQSVRVSDSSTLINGRDPDTFFNNYRIDSETLALGLQADLEVLPSQTVNLGASREERSADNQGNFDEEATLQAVYAQWQWALGGSVFATLGARHDDHSVFGSEDSVRATLSAELPGGQTRLRGSYGTAFRAPNFNELYFPFAGDPALQPETSEGWDLGVVQRWSEGLTLDVGVFDLQFDNLIAFDLNTFLFGNIVEASSRGVEASLRWRFAPGNELSLSHTYNETENDATGAALARRPRNRTALVGLWQPHRSVALSLSGFAVNDRVDSNGQLMDDYLRVDLGLRYSVTSWLAPYIRLENVFDEDYEEVPGFTTPGATAMVGVTVRR